MRLNQRWTISAVFLNGETALCRRRTAALLVVLASACAGLTACGGTKTTEPPNVCLAWPQACHDGKPLISEKPLTKTEDHQGRTCYEMAYTEGWPDHTGSDIRLCGRPGAPSAGITCYAGSRRLGPNASGKWPEACDIANVALNDYKLVWASAG